MTNIKQERLDWQSGNHFNAGIDAAAVLNLLLPFNTEEGDPHKPKSVSVVDAVSALTGVVNMFGGELDFGPACWKMAYGRGVGKAISACREGEERRGALCYPLCRDGYVGRGPVCW